ncbi:MAG: helix-turn-helix domain-containing protein [Allorhizobium sp.]
MGSFDFMKLGTYIKTEGKTAEDMAQAIGDVSVSGLRKWIAGERVPRPDQMRRIVEVTGGKVLPNDFYDIPEAAE